jgi:hypothetical protein
MAGRCVRHSKRCCARCLACDWKKVNRDCGSNRPLTGRGNLQGWEDLQRKWDGLEAEQALNAQQAEQALDAQQAQQTGQNEQVQAAVASVKHMQQAQQQMAHQICIQSRHNIAGTAGTAAAADIAGTAGCIGLACVANLTRSTA